MDNIASPRKAGGDIPWSLQSRLKKDFVSTERQAGFDKKTTKTRQVYKVLPDYSDFAKATRDIRSEVSE